MSWNQAGWQLHKTVNELSIIGVYTLNWFISLQGEKKNINKANPVLAGCMLSWAPNLPGSHGALSFWASSPGMHARPQPFSRSENVKQDSNCTKALGLWLPTYRPAPGMETQQQPASQKAKPCRLENILGVLAGESSHFPLKWRQSKEIRFRPIMIRTTLRRQGGVWRLPNQLFQQTQQGEPSPKHSLLCSLPQSFIPF